MTNQAKDLVIRRHEPLLMRVFLRILRRPINTFAKSVIGRAYERGHIDSTAMHFLGGIIDRSLWPERHDDVTGIPVDPIPQEVLWACKTCGALNSFPLCQLTPNCHNNMRLVASLS